MGKQLEDLWEMKNENPENSKKSNGLSRIQQLFFAELFLHSLNIRMLCDYYVLSKRERKKYLQLGEEKDQIYFILSKVS